MIILDIKTSKAATKAKNKYNANNYDSLRIVVPKGRKAELQEHAASRDESLNGFVNRAIDEAIERDGEGVSYEEAENIS